MSTTLVIVLASVLLIGVAIAAMAIGVMFKRPCLRGSCGGQLACEGCPNRERKGPA
jgi:hypothetical protein